MSTGNIHRDASIVSRYTAFRRAIIIALLLTVYYVSCVYLFLTKLQDYAYCQIFLANPSGIKILIGYMTVISVGFLQRKEAAPYNLFLWTIYIVMIVPRFVIFGCRDTDASYPFICLTVYLMAALCSHILLKGRHSGDLKHSEQAEIGKYALWAVVAITVILLIVVVALKGLPSARAFNLSDTYEIRASNDFPTLVNSLLSFLGIFALPYSISLLVTREHYKGASLLTAAQLALFLWTANKAWLFMIPLAWFLPLLVKRDKLNVTAICAFMAILTLFLSIYTTVSNSELSTWLFSLFYRRLIFIPAALGNVYYDFFQSNPVILFDGTILGALTPTPEQYRFITYQVQISPLAFGISSETYANTGVFGGEFANFGLLGWLALLIGTIITCAFLGPGKRSEGNSYRMVIAVLLAYGLLNYTYIRLYLSVMGVLVIALLYAYFKDSTVVHPAIADDSASTAKYSYFTNDREWRIGLENG